MLLRVASVWLTMASSGGVHRRPIQCCSAPPPPGGDELLDALYENGDGVPSTNEDSHLFVERTETGEPVEARFTYVDEPQCIGCTYCSSIARNTFFMEDEHGRARVFDQGGDGISLIDEAIDSCPVNCIHWVSYEDLVILETERRGQRINNAARLRSQQESTSDAPPTRATFFDSGAMRCNNCPGRGCNECPMFGVGQNPVYLERLAAREERQRESGEAQAEEEQQRRDALVDSLYRESDAQTSFVDVEVTVPDGHRAGDEFVTYEGAEDGCRVVVPEGCGPGDVIWVSIPAQACDGPDVQAPTPAAADDDDVAPTDGLLANDEALEALFGGGYASLDSGVE